MSQLIYKAELLGGVRRMVVKVGSAVLSDGGGLRSGVIPRLTGDIDSLMGRGYQVVLVTSGAIAAGRARLGAPLGAAIAMRQAAAAAGQIALMTQYAQAFESYRRQIAQILLTHSDLAERTRRNNARHTIETLLQHGIVPIINENDTVAVEEIRFGDNDNLSALVATLVQAQLLIILSDVEGVLTGDPHYRADARLIPLIADPDAGMKGLVAGSVGPLGTGGMASKLKAARQAARAGIAVIIASGHEPGALRDAIDSERERGTLVMPASTRIRGRKHWIAFVLKPLGSLGLDRGAADAVRNKGRSLLPSGVREVAGDFAGGDCVSLLDQDGHEFGRGLVNYPAADVARLKGRRTSEIAAILGYQLADEIIHRDNLVLL
ncbi:MAG TPA: glutamate 5-kinase [Candidatus Binataceae bacterium]|nr:glutamate 5-kinase [Candidatus Binataceae bacterium]